MKKKQPVGAPKKPDAEKKKGFTVTVKARNIPLFKAKINKLKLALDK